MAAHQGTTLSGDQDGTILLGETLAQHPELAKLSAALQAPQGALRARLNAVVVDLILLGLVTQLVLSVARGSTSRSEHALVFLVLEIAYFFVCELRSGRTIGKRLFHVRVVTASGAPATYGQIALRNVLRLVDALPFLYASGLISMMRTGPARRQRIGDVAAGTTVVLAEGGRALRTPRWLLPTLALLATALSLAIVIPALSGSRAGSAGQAPVEGAWLATASNSVGYGSQRPSSATWTITRNCPATGPCRFVLGFQAPGEAPVSAPLIASSGGWLAVFPALTYPCGEQPSGRRTYWKQHALIGLRFTDSGLAAEGEERDFWQSPRCGYGAGARRWAARYAGPA
jgi:uncharacterized RDD family membrane protein YckC